MRTKSFVPTKSLLGVALLTGLIACSSGFASSKPVVLPDAKLDVPAAKGDQTAVFAGGCFWGVEDNFRQVPGVVATAVGYTGGHTQSPTYETVSGHSTGHAEAVLVEYDPTKITYEQLVVVFFKNHDPTTMNRQGPDIGSNYRSAVFTFDDKQAAIVAKVMAAEEKERKEKLVTIVSPIAQFWKAEEYHQQYDEKTGTHSCPMPRGLPKST